MGSENSFTSKIEGYNKGGLLVPLGTIRGFVPASQIGLGRRLTITGNSPEERYSEMMGEEIDVCVIEVDRERRRLILSERAASSETRDTIKERVIEDLKEGEIRTGRVTSLADFGAFVNINGADGLVHLSEISWEHVNHPSEVLEIGQEIKVKVISIDTERKRIGLSIRRLKDDPWDDQVAELTEGQLVEGRITRLTNFGAFARLILENAEGDLEGLIHISEISEQRIEHPKEVLKEGDVVTLRIIKIEGDTHRIGLSMRRVDSPAYTDLDWKTLTDELTAEELTEADAAEDADKIEEDTPAEEPQAEAEEVETPEAEVEEEVEPQAEAEEVEEPQAEVEKVETPEVEAEEEEEPQAEAEEVEEPQAEAEEEEEPQAEADKVDEPQAETEEVEEPQAEADKVDEPEADEPSEEEITSEDKEED